MLVCVTLMNQLEVPHQHQPLGPPRIQPLVQRVRQRSQLMNLQAVQRQCQHQAQLSPLLNQPPLLPMDLLLLRQVNPRLRQLRAPLLRLHLQRRDPPRLQLPNPRASQHQVQPASQQSSRPQDPRANQLWALPTSQLTNQLCSRATREPPRNAGTEAPTPGMPSAWPLAMAVTK